MVIDGNHSYYMAVQSKIFKSQCHRLAHYTNYIFYFLFPYWFIWLKNISFENKTKKKSILNDSI